MTYLVPKILAGRLEFGVSRKPPSCTSDPKDGFKRGMSGIFECAACGTVTSRDYTAAYATKHGFGVVPTAVVCDGPNGRVYLPSSASRVTGRLPPVDLHDLEIELSANPRDVWCRNFGLKKPSDLFTSRQLVMLTSLSDLVCEVRRKIREDAQRAGMADDGKGLEAGGTTATAYSEAVSIYLSLAVDKITDYNSNLVAWSPTRNQAKTTFARQALPMVWDFTEVNPFAGAAGDIAISIEGICRSLRAHQGYGFGSAMQCDAQSQTITTKKFVSTDPPYYDNIGYADLSDYFYVWLRRSLKTVLPGLFTTMAVPKSEELVAVAYRHGSKAKAEAFFLEGMTRAMHSLAVQAHPEAPITIYYAFKQAETTSEAGTSSTGWETFLNAVLCAGFQLTGTWPMRTERESRSVGIGTNSLASSIILVCRQRSSRALTISRREFLRELNAVLPEALDEMTKGAGGEQSPVAPVDLSQAIIGPGMAVFSKYAAILEADGSPMTVRTALQLINRFLAEDDFDADTQFCLHWFEQHGWVDGPFGEADTLSRGKGTSVNGIKEAGVIQSGGGNVRLLKWSDYPPDWDPRTDTRTPVWEALHQLIRALKQGGESSSGALLAAIGGKAEAVRQLAYRLYTLCERLGHAEDARAYNELITSWTGIESAASSVTTPQSVAQHLPGFEK